MRVALLIPALMLPSVAVAQNTAAYMTCGKVANGFELLRKSAEADGSRARASLAAAEGSYFADGLGDFHETQGPNANGVFDSAGTDADTLLAEARSCILEEDCAEGLDDRLAQVAEGLSTACRNDLMGRS